MAARQLEVVREDCRQLIAECEDRQAVARAQLQEVVAMRERIRVMRARIERLCAAATPDGTPWMTDTALSDGLFEGPRWLVRSDFNGDR
jgi:hypothetical protein